MTHKHRLRVLRKSHSSTESLGPIRIVDTGREVIVKLKEGECVQVNHHKDIGKVIEEWKRKGGRLHTYQASGYGTDVKHYLLFEKSE